MRNAEFYIDFTGDEYLLVCYDGPRPCGTQRTLLYMLQQAVRSERTTYRSGCSQAANAGTAHEVSLILATFEHHLEHCRNCGGYVLDPSTLD